MARAIERLDSFTDAAFAFAVTMLVIGGTGSLTAYDELAAAVAEVPIFAIGFAIIAMFWTAHVRWRDLRGEGSWLSTLLSLLLVFLVLVYVQPLRAMARALASFLGGGAAPYRGDLGDLFVVYSASFVLTCAIVVALFADARHHAPAGSPERVEAHGTVIIWLILVVTGLAAMLFASVRGLATLAPWTYATLPLTIGSFAGRYQWTQPGPPPAAAE